MEIASLSVLEISTHSESNPADKLRRIDEFRKAGLGGSKVTRFHRSAARETWEFDRSLYLTGWLSTGTRGH